MQTAYGKEETVITLLTRWWQGPCKHAVIVGDGGMGKTVSLVRLWESLLIKSFLGVQGAIFQKSPLAAGGNNDEPVPVFIALNELNQVKEENRRGFILNYIRENYCDSSTSIEEIWDALKLPAPEGSLNPKTVVSRTGWRAWASCCGTSWKHRWGTWGSDWVRSGQRFIIINSYRSGSS